VAKGSNAKITIARLSLIMRLYSRHIFSNGNGLSQQLDVVPNGGSHKIKSMELSGTSFINSKQSQQYN
jgi:hypothetical protein